MDKNIPQFQLNISTVPKAGYSKNLSLGSQELDTVARHCELVAINEFSASVECKPWHRDGVTISGHVKAKIEQACVVSLEPVFSTVDVEFSARFLPDTSKLARPPKQVDGEIVFDFEGEDAPDIIEGEEVNLWEVVLEHFNLEIDHFPRAEGQALSEDLHDGSEEDATTNEKISPFAVLSSLKRNDS